MLTDQIRSLTGPLTWSLRLGEATTILNYFEDFIPLKRDSQRESGDEL